MYGSILILVISFSSCVPSMCLSQMKLELVTGATAGLCDLQLFDTEGKLVCLMDNDDVPLGSYPVLNGYRVHVSKMNIQQFFIYI